MPFIVFIISTLDESNPHLSEILSGVLIVKYTKAKNLGG